MTVTQSDVAHVWDDTNPTPVDDRVTETMQGHVSDSLETKSLHYSDDPRLSYISSAIEERMTPIRRAKTPVYFIGQLESKPQKSKGPDLASALAEQYCALLPERNWTPFPDGRVAEINPKKRLRKIKPQDNLRSFVSHCSKPSFCSDSETLVGSDTTSENGARSEDEKPVVSRDDNPLKEPPREFGKGLSDGGEDATDEKSAHAGVGHQICLDLLTNELAEAISCRQPRDNDHVASQLWIRLMIEAYESAQRYLQQECSENFPRSVRGVLDRWLDALRSVYELSRAEEAKTSGVWKPGCAERSRVNSGRARTRPYSTTFV